MKQECKNTPRMRLHLWLETEEGMFFGIGRSQLLEKIDEHGSLKKAAKELGMSYRAAWGKIMKTEEVLGFKLVEKEGSGNKSGYRLTEAGKMLLARFKDWYYEVERHALKIASESFPWPVAGFEEASSKKRSPVQGD